MGFSPFSCKWLYDRLVMSCYHLQANTQEAWERGVLWAVGAVAAVGSCTCESPLLVSGWVIRNDRLENVGIPNQNQSICGVWGFFSSFCYVGFLHWTETFSVQQFFFCLLALGECSGCEQYVCVCLTFREFVDDWVVIDGKNPNGRLCIFALVHL